MDSPDKIESEPSFRKISSETAGRSYRRRGSDSSHSDESPKNEKYKVEKMKSQNHSEREIEKTKSHNRSERDYDRHSDDYKRHNLSKRYDHHAKKYDNNPDYKIRNRDHERKDRERKDESRDRERKDRHNREYHNRDKERKDYHERENEKKDRNERKDYHEKRKHRENASSFTDEVKPRESKFSKPEVKVIEEKEKPSSSVPTQSGTDLNAAKAAAMKAADCVNKNIGGPIGGSLTTEQKKKMLWGNKKNEPTQDITKNWDLNLFADRERQEKFNKLMGVKGQNSAQETETETEKEMKDVQKLEMDLEKQYTAGLRRRDGRTVGLGL